MARTLFLASLTLLTLLTIAPTLPSAAADTCKNRYAALTDRFSAEYINLDAECYPGESSDLTASCGFELSPECQERYNALAQESTEAYNALFEECPDLLTPIFVDVTQVDSPPVMYGDRQAPAGPVVRAPTKREMLTQLKSLKKQLRRSQAKNKKLRSRCSR